MIIQKKSLVKGVIGGYLKMAHNVWCYEQVCLAEMFKLPKMLLANLLIARVI